MTVKIGEYEIFCTETGGGATASVFVCEIYSPEIGPGRELGAINFKVWKKPRRYIEVHYPEGFVNAFNRVFGSMDMETLLRGKRGKVAKTLEWIVATVIREGLWDPAEEFARRAEKKTAKRGKRALGATA